MGRDSLKFWLAGGVDWTPFDPQLLEELKEHIQLNHKCFDATTKDDKQIKQIVRSIVRLSAEFRSIRQSLRAEGGAPCGKLFSLPISFKSKIKPTMLGVDFESLACSGSRNWQTKFVEFFKKHKLDCLSGKKDPQSDERKVSLFEIIDNFLGSLDSLAASRQLRSEIPRWRARWSYQDHLGDQERLYALIWSVSELAYCYTRRAKVLAHGRSVPLPFTAEIMEGSEEEAYKREKERQIVLKHWLVVSALCWLCIDLCRSLDPDFADFEVSSKVKCNTLYGLALGYLNRFTEAHRRLNEAHALMSRGRRGLRGTEFAVLHLRRAEVYLTQAEAPGNKRPDQKLDALFFACIDDAWASLERAEKALSGSSHSSLWWGRLYSLKLRTYSLFRHLGDGDIASIRESRRMPLPFRRRLQHDEYVRQLIERALLTNDGDYYRILRVSRYYARVVKAFKKMRIGDLEPRYELVAKALEEVKSRRENGQLPDLISNFYDRVHKEFIELDDSAGA